MKALYIPEDTAKTRIEEITGSNAHEELKAMQNAIGGYIETVRFGRDVALLVDEMGTLKALRQNPLASLIAQRIILGTALLVGVEPDPDGDGDRFCDCPERYLRIFG